jgi:hypothetical protein
MIWCDWQPHPLLFVWTFLAAGIIRSHATHRDVVGNGAFLRLLMELAAADLVGYHAFVMAAAVSLRTVVGLVQAWVLSLALSYPVRLVVAQRVSRRPCAPFARAAVLPASGAGTLAAAAASSTAVLVLAMLLLKLELQERGEALDAARYSWHIATFYLGGGFCSACALGAGLGTGVAPPPGGPRPPPPRVGDVERSSGNSDLDGTPCKPSRASVWPAGTHGIPFRAMSAPCAEAPLAASLLCVAAFGVLPRCSGCTDKACHGGPARASRRRLPAPLVCLCASVGVLAAYIGAVRCGLAPPLELGPLLDVRCVATLPPEAAAADVGAAVKKPDTAADGAADGVDEGVTEWVSIGDEWTLLSLLYGRRRVAIPPRCPSSIPRRSYAPAAASKADAAPRHGLSTGLVLTADGQQPKYARAAFVALHNVRRLQRSSLPAEVFHIGPAEAVEPDARSRLAALGDVAVIDLLERLPQRLRAAASTRLRSFAAKPFALLVASFEVVLLLDSNALLFQPPEALLSLPAFRATGVQLFNDYVAAFQIVDPWLLTGYLGSGESAARAYESLTRGAEVDSSMVIVDKRRAWAYVHLVAALNWWSPMLDRHSWGDKDSWAFAAVVLSGRKGGYGGAGGAGADADGGDGEGGGVVVGEIEGDGGGDDGGDGRGGASGSRAGTAGTLVGWLTRDVPGSLASQPPTPVWGHVQFDEARLAEGTGMLYLNWQPHYAAGFLRLQRLSATGAVAADSSEENASAFAVPEAVAGAEAAALTCCVLLRDQWEGPHAETPHHPTTPAAAAAAHRYAVRSTLSDAARALRLLEAPPLVPPHWWGQVRYRRCTIYFGVLWGGGAFAAHSAYASLSTRTRPLRPRVASASAWRDV